MENGLLVELMELMVLVMLGMMRQDRVDVRAGVSVRGKVVVMGTHPHVCVCMCSRQ